MPENLFRKGKTERHEEDRPIDRVEAENILSDNVKICGPVFFEVLALPVNVVAQRGYIVRERVDPNVDDMFRVERNGNAPFERGSRNAQILKTGFEEVVYHLFLSQLGTDEIGVFLDIFHQPVRIFGHSEKVSLFFCSFYGASAVGTLSVNDLRFREEGFARFAVPALVFGLIYVSLIVKFFEYILNGFFMIFVGRSDEIVVTRADQIPDVPDLRRDTVHERFRRHSVFLRAVLDLLPVFVGSRAEENVKSRKSFVSCYRVGQYDLVCVADVRLSRRVRYRRCDIIRFLFRHSVSTPCYL